MTGMELPMIATMVSGGLEIATGIMSAVQGSRAADAEADYATKIQKSTVPSMNPSLFED
jgi:hypothetical protein